MTSPKASARIGAASILLSILFVLVSLAFGALAGGAWVRFVMPKPPDGWTGIANALGGLMVGAALGVVIAAALLVPLLRRGAGAVGRAAAGVALGTLLLLGILVATRPQRLQETEEPVRIQKVTRREGAFEGREIAP